MLTSSAWLAPMYKLLIRIRRLARLNMSKRVLRNSSGEPRSDTSSPRQPKHGCEADSCSCSPRNVASWCGGTGCEVAGGSLDDVASWLLYRTEQERGPIAIGVGGTVPGYRALLLDAHVKAGSLEGPAMASGAARSALATRTEGLIISARVQTSWESDKSTGLCRAVSKHLPG